MPKMWIYSQTKACSTFTLRHYSQSRSKNGELKIFFVSRALFVKLILMLVFQFSKVEEEAAANNGVSLVVQTKITELPSSVSSQPLALQSTTKVADKAFQCPICPMKISHALKRNHLVKHFYAQLSTEIALNGASEPPFECHLCRHVAIDKMR